MSRSKAGTMKTTSYIDTDSKKYVQKTSSGHTKREDSGLTDAAHIFGLANTIITNTGGRPMSELRRPELIRGMNHPTDMRIKSTYGNRVHDERRDARIAHACVNNENIRGIMLTKPKSASNFTTMDSLAAQLGNIRVYDESAGRNTAMQFLTATNLSTAPASLLSIVLFCFVLFCARLMQ